MLDLAPGLEPAIAGECHEDDQDTQHYADVRCDEHDCAQVVLPGCSVVAVPNSHVVIRLDHDFIEWSQG